MTRLREALILFSPWDNVRQLGPNRERAFSRMIQVTRGLFGNRATCLTLAVLTLGKAGAQSNGVEFFEKNVRPLFAQRCLECHAAVDHPAGSLRLDSRESLLQGGARGPAIVAGKPEESLM